MFDTVTINITDNEDDDCDDDNASIMITNLIVVTKYKILLTLKPISVPNLYI